MGIFASSKEATGSALKSRQLGGTVPAQKRLRGSLFRDLGFRVWGVGFQDHLATRASAPKYEPQDALKLRVAGRTAPWNGSQ